MSKMKTHKAAAKRVSVTGSGKLKRRKVGLCHLQTGRSSRTQMRNNDGAQSVSRADEKAVNRMIGR
jgi:large subunit ribosomal protein L35